MPDAFWLSAALLAALLGMACLALAMDVHWRQVRNAARTRRSAVATRCLGYGLLAASLAFCLVADTATMAVLVWMVLLAVGATAVAFTLSWRPSLLGPLAMGSRGARRPTRRSTAR
jgi:UDP-N-acetylmuramyl pentapeptide phosphotransferase/UDP-N-acetylglucosamine-1-phosphate transferase